MNENTKTKPQYLRPFRRFCMTIGELPTSYIESMTYYEMLLWFTKYLSDTVIPAINNNAEALEEVQKGLVDLKNYVDEYFENLDLQEEIDKALDEMIESGKLAEIIAEFLNSNAVLGFNDIASLKVADNLVDGAFVRTYGKDELNDGNGRFYKVRLKTSEDVIDDFNIIQLHDETLVAVLMKDLLDNPINVLLHGVMGDGINEDTDAIQTLIDNYPNRTLYFPEGTYLVDEPLVTSARYDKSVQLLLDKYAIIKATNNFVGDFVIKLGGKDTDDQSMYNIGTLYGLNGGIIDCNDVAGGISVYGISPTVSNCEIRNSATIGLYVPYGMHNGSSDCRINGIHVFGNNSPNSIGVKCEGLDNTFEHIRTYRTHIGFHLEGGANYLQNIHCLYSNDNLTYYNDSKGFYIKGWNHSLYQCYSDQFSTGFYVDGNYRCYLYTPYVFYWQGGNYNHTAFYCNGKFNLFISDPWVEFKDAQGTNTVLQVINETSPEGNITNLSISNISFINGANEKCLNPRYNYNRRFLQLSEVTTSGTIQQNQTTANNGVVNFSLVFTNMAITRKVNTTIMTLPVGWRPLSTVNVMVKTLADKTYNYITAWIATDGTVHVDSEIDLSSTERLQILGTYVVV